MRQNIYKALDRRNATFFSFSHIMSCRIRRPVQSWIMNIKLRFPAFAGMTVLACMIAGAMLRSLRCFGINDDECGKGDEIGDPDSRWSLLRT
jgi:hypothetical protein